MSRLKSVLLIAAAVVLLAGCAAQGGAQAVPDTASAATPAGAAGQGAEPGSTPFATIVPQTGAADSPLAGQAANAVTSTGAVTGTGAVTLTGATSGTATSAPVSASQGMTATGAVTGTGAAPASQASATYRLVLQPDSQVGYRVREQLARLQIPSDAVGTTKTVTGTLVIGADGKIASDQSKFVADLSTLASDSGMRDGYIKRNTLQTGNYPNAVFVPAAIEGLPSPLPTSGDVNFKVTGDLTVHGVTKPVTWDVQAKIAGNDVTGTAKTTVKFEDFGMTPPQTMMVLSVQDNIGLEVTFHMTANQG